MDMTFLYGLIGGLLPDAIRIINNRYNPVLPEYLKSPSFYIGTLFWWFSAAERPSFFRPTR
ncbi:MAG: hypothetical protein IPH16_11650 [Haliscomenobacter sp.]|nr:hypothetical protein [Haliscomenobacter sp.]